MSGFATSEIHDGLEDRLGDALRGVVCYNATTLESVLREDVATLYTDEEIQEFVDNTIVHQLGQPDAEEVFELGHMESVTRTFEDSWVVRVPLVRESKRGCLFSDERDGSVTRAAIDDCLAVDEEQSNE
mgnify:CR=1 FL=1